MGYDKYDGVAHTALTSARATRSVEEVFTQKNLHPTMDPRGVKLRESRDSDNHPNSTGIIFALDQTGSMGDLPVMLAKEELPYFMQLIIDGKFVDDPQLMFVGIGDAQCREQAPLQVGQFEAEASLMDQWLTRIYLEGKGGGNGGESYDLALYFAAYHTAMDCYEKRKEKGFLFINGDEPHLQASEKVLIEQYLGESIPKDIPMSKLVADASKMYNVFFLIPDQGRRRGCEGAWRPILGDNVICMDDPKDTCAVSATLIGLTNGRLPTLEAAAKKLEELGRSEGQIKRIIGAVTPYAVSIGRGGKTVTKKEAAAKAKKDTRL
jgi:hypothetical protein